MNLPPPEWHLSIDSTNSHLLRKFEADEDFHDGYAVAAHHQTEGRGQRNKRWIDSWGKSLLLSVGARPVADLEHQALFCFGIAATVAVVLEALFVLEGKLWIKWPNDLYIGDRKLGGILIENSLRGAQWHIAVAGLGLNLFKYETEEEDFRTPPTFLVEHTSKEVSAEQLAVHFQRALTHFMTQPLQPDIMARYNQRLYRQGAFQTFETDGKQWQGKVCNAQPDGRLVVLQEGQYRLCTHGVDLWVPGSF